MNSDFVLDWGERRKRSVHRRSHGRRSCPLWGGQERCPGGAVQQSSSGPPHRLDADPEELGDLGHATAFLVAHAAHLDPLSGREAKGAASNPAALLGGLPPVGRTGAPEEEAALVAVLAAEESSFISGQVYQVDGGRMAKLSLPSDHFDPQANDDISETPRRARRV